MLGWVAVGLGVVALVVAGWAWDTARARRYPRGSPIPADLESIRKEVEALRDDAAQALRHLAVVRYDAFRDMGGHLSWSLALVDDEGNGMVLTSIHGRNDVRSYAKGIAGWKSGQELSPEESEAIGYARNKR
ncbi:MAG TPA: DUF4446 family protein [Nocardioidaceae bacterium]|nr:DUF4446 family protein [Nocardioidaceae bacterium]